MRRKKRTVMGNWRTAAVFEVFYKLAAVVILIPLLFGSFALAMRWSGHSYLSHENVLAFLRAPVTLTASAVNAVAVGVYLTVDISAVIFLLDQSAQGRRTAPAQVLRFAASNTARALRLKNILLIPVTLAVVPFFNLALLTGFAAAVSVPAPILDYLERKPAIPLTAAAVVLVLTALGTRWMYTVFYFTLEGCSFRDARKRCARLGRGRHVRDFAIMLIVQLAFSALAVILLLAGTGIAGGIGAFLSRITGPEWTGSYAVWLAIVLLLALTAALAVPVGFGHAGVLYFRSKARAGERILHAPEPEARQQPDRSRWGRLLKGVGAAVIVAGSLSIFFLISAGKLNPDVEYLHTTQITAHRGACAFFPENTMAAFSGALDLGADWIELDVQQSRDGQLVVAHDANLKRTTGVNAYVWDLTYAQIAALDAGAGFGEAFAGERIPLLSEVLAFAKENEIQLNIELKPTGHETDMERAVVDAIHEAELADRCVVTSQSYQVLENVKAYDETITTVYVMRFVYGNIGALSAADHFSVDAVSVTRSLVSRVHSAGKQLYVWTVNTRKSIEKMIGLNVDNIITDDVDLAKQCVFESRYSEMLDEYIDLLQ